jgi:hypothetical protein
MIDPVNNYPVSQLFDIEVDLVYFKFESDVS